MARLGHAGIFRPGTDLLIVVIVVCGVSGCGKTTVGQLLATRLGWLFYDADDFHPSQNIEKMRAGTPLTDADRASWLGSLAELIASKDNIVLACSALKTRYRQQLGIDQQRVKSVFLAGDQSTIAERIAQRQHVYMPTSLLQSQFDALEPPTDGLTISITNSPAAICEHVVITLGLTALKQS